MEAKKNPLDNHKKFLLNRWTCTTPFVEFLEHCVATEDEAANHSFHKIMVHHWTDSKPKLYEAFSDYFTSYFIPVAGTTQAGVTSFYSSSLSLINKIIRYDFMFPYQQNMYCLDVLFNSKSSMELFDSTITVDNIVSSVVSRRFSDKRELDLSDFCADQEFTDKNVGFYKISLLAYFKILMLRMGRDTKSLNLSNNNLVQPPIEILNFFIKGDLTSINLCHNKINSISDLFRVSSKIEKLWVEGNPLCDKIEPSAYVKGIIMKFPRLSELDGIRVNDTGLHFPFVRNFLEAPDRMTKMLVEKFLTIYFAQYDTPKRTGIYGFYNDKSTLTITTRFSASDEIEMSTYTSHGRNILSQRVSATNINRVYTGVDSLRYVLGERLPATVHDPSTFTVDVLHHDRHMLILVVTGLFKEKYAVNHIPKVFHFRRTFALKNFQHTGSTWTYVILNELLHITAATHEQTVHSFKKPIKNPNSLMLIDPEREEGETIVKIFTHITQLKKEAEIRLRIHKWDIREAITEFINDIARNNVSHHSFVEDDDISDISSLMDEDMVD